MNPVGLPGRRAWHGIIGAGVALLLVGSLARAADNDHGQAAAATAAPPHARVSVAEGEVSVTGPFDAEPVSVSTNAVIREGDELATADNGSAEIELAGGSFVRVGAASKLKIRRIAERLEVELVSGTVYLASGAEQQQTSVVAGADRVVLDPGSVTRVDRAAGDAHAVVRQVRGLAALVGCGEGEVAEAREQLSCPDGVPVKAGWPPAEHDAFDLWAAGRDRGLRRSTVPAAVSGVGYEGLHDLEGGGTWVEVDGEPAWQPEVEQDWRPYRDGYWSWVEPYGWVWVPERSWGYVTHHYGRWSHSNRLGWYWRPVPGWAPAWVVWADFGGYVGWAPVGAYGRPVVVSVSYSYYDPYSWCFADPYYFYWGGGWYWSDAGRSRCYGAYHCHHHRHHDNYRERPRPGRDRGPGRGDRSGGRIANAGDRPGDGSRPIFTLGASELSALKPSPLRQPRRELAPAPRAVRMTGLDPSPDGAGGTAAGRPGVSTPRGSQPQIRDDNRLSRMVRSNGGPRSAPEGARHTVSPMRPRRAVSPATPRRAVSPDTPHRARPEVGPGRRPQRPSTPARTQQRHRAIDRPPPATLPGAERGAIKPAKRKTAPVVKPVRPKKKND